VRLSLHRFRQPEGPGDLDLIFPPYLQGNSFSPNLFPLFPLTFRTLIYLSFFLRKTLPFTITSPPPQFSSSKTIFSCRTGSSQARKTNSSLPLPSRLRAPPSLSPLLVVYLSDFPDISMSSVLGLISWFQFSLYPCPSPFSSPILFIPFCFLSPCFPIFQISKTESKCLQRTVHSFPYFFQRELWPFFFVLPSLLTPYRGLMGSQIPFFSFSGFSGGFPTSRFLPSECIRPFLFDLFSGVPRIRVT